MGNGGRGAADMTIRGSQMGGSSQPSLQYSPSPSASPSTSPSSVASSSVAFTPGSGSGFRLTPDQKRKIEESKRKAQARLKAGAKRQRVEATPPSAERPLCPPFPPSPPPRRTAVAALAGTASRVATVVKVVKVATVVWRWVDGTRWPLSLANPYRWYHRHRRHHRRCRPRPRRFLRPRPHY